MEREGPVGPSPPAHAFRRSEPVYRRHHIAAGVDDRAALGEEVGGPVLEERDALDARKAADRAAVEERFAGGALDHAPGPDPAVLLHVRGLIAAAEHR